MTPRFFLPIMASASETAPPELPSQRLPHLAALSPQERAEEISRELCERLMRIDIDSEIESAALINFIYENVEHNEVEELAIFNVVQLFLQTAELSDDCKFYFLQLLNAIFQFDPTNRFLSVFCHNQDVYTYIMQTLLVMFSDKPSDLANAILALHLWTETPEYQSALSDEFRRYVADTLPLYEQISKALEDRERQQAQQREADELGLDQKRDPSGMRGLRKYTLGCKMVMCRRCNVLVHSDALAVHENEHVLRERREKSGGTYCRAWNTTLSQWMTAGNTLVAKDEYIRCALGVTGE